MGQQEGELQCMLSCMSDRVAGRDEAGCEQLENRKRAKSLLFRRSHIRQCKKYVMRNAKIAIAFVNHEANLRAHTESSADGGGKG